MTFRSFYNVLAFLDVTDQTNSDFTLKRKIIIHQETHTMFTARIRRMGEGTVFSLFVSPHFDGGYPSQVWMVGEVPWPGLDGGGEGYPSQV